MKVNPVIAMSIGSSESQPTDVKIPTKFDKKKGFDKKETTNIDNNTNINNETNETEDLAIAHTDISENEFLEMFSSKNIDINNNLENDNEVIDIETDINEENHNKYIRKTDKKVIYFSGDAGKISTADNISDNIIVKDKKYLFAPTHKKLPQTRGTINKKFASSAK